MARFKMSKEIKVASRKASIGAAMTWVVATIIIFIVIIIFVYVASILAESRGFFSRSSVASTYRLVEMDTQETLFALLDTDVGGGKVQEYIAREDYASLELKLKPFLQRLPGPENGNWVFRVYKNDKLQLQIGKPTGIIPDSNPSQVYLSDKKILLGFEYEYIPM